MRIVIADDQASVRSALKLLLEDRPGWQIVGEAHDVISLFSILRTVRPDVILLDWELPGLMHAGELAALRVQCPELQVLILSGRPEAQREALVAGASAFVSKGDPPERLILTLAALDSTSDETHGMTNT